MSETPDDFAELPYDLQNQRTSDEWTELRTAQRSDLEALKERHANESGKIRGEIEQLQDELRELLQEHRRERRDLDEHHSRERSDLTHQQNERWRQIEEKESAPSAIAKRVKAVNSAISESFRDDRAEREGQKQAERMEKTFKKICIKFTLAAQSIDDAIEELEGRIEASQIHLSSGNMARVQRAIARMRQAIIELGGTPKPDPESPWGRTFEGVPQHPPTSKLSDDEMNALLDGK